MLKKLILLILLIGIAGSAFAAIDYTDPKQPFMPYYWLKGRVQLPQGIAGSIKDRVVYFYRDDISKAIKVKTDAAGVFQINVWDLYYYDQLEPQITFGPQVYKVAVENSPVDNYGLDPKNQELTFQVGYQNVILTLGLGQGPIGFHIVNDALLPDATKGKAYEQFIEAAGGITPYAWSYVDSLPAGMKLEKDGDKFKLSGTPDEIGKFTFTVTVTDANGETAQKIFTLNVKETVVPQVTDDGPVILEILRVSPDIMVKWKFNPAYNLSANTPVDIYALGGSGSGSFVQAYDPLKWVKIVSGAIAGQPLENKTITINSILMDYVVDPSDPNNKHVRVKNQVGFASTHKELYFKALPATDAWPATTFLPAVMSVGKVDVGVGAGGGKALVGLPFYCGTATGVFTGQLQPGQVIYASVRSGTGLDVVKILSNSVIGQNFVIDPMIGFWMQTPKGTNYSLVITFLGKLMNTETIKALATKDLTGNPLPVSFSSLNLGASGDIISVQAGTGLSPMLRTQNGWGEFTKLGLNQGFWYKSAALRQWHVKPLSSSAVIEPIP